MTDPKERPWYEPGDPPDQPEWTWEPHGDGWALMQGRHSRLHGYNRITVREGGFDASGQAMRDLVARLLNGWADDPARVLERQLDRVRNFIDEAMGLQPHEPMEELFGRFERWFHARRLSWLRADAENESALKLVAAVHRDGGKRVGEIGFQAACDEALELLERERGPKNA